MLTGGSRQGSLVEPTLVADVRPRCASVATNCLARPWPSTRCANIDEAIRLANDTNYGLQRGIFTQDIDWAIRFAREVESGNLHVNWGPGWRADLMPYGGLKDSGMGKEGPKYAIAEMTELKTVVIHERSTRGIRHCSFRWAGYFSVAVETVASMLQPSNRATKFCPANPRLVTMRSRPR